MTGMAVLRMPALKRHHRAGGDPYHFDRTKNAARDDSGGIFLSA
jgi:hypothetical protein